MKKRNEVKLAVAEKLRARRGKKKVWQKRPTLAKCPFPGCETMINTFMCPEHWPHVKPDTRRALINLVRELKFHGGRRPTGDIVELFQKAITEVQTALYKQGATNVPRHLDGNLSAARPPLHLREVLPPTAQHGGLAPAPEGLDGRARLVALPTREQVEEFGQGDGAGAGPGLPPGTTKG